MTSLTKFFLFCPIPDQQKPITEYVETKNNVLGNWFFLQISNCIEKVLFWFVFLSFFLIFSLLWNQMNFFFSFLFLFLGSFNLFLFFLGSFLLIWKQVHQRFFQSRLFYEEGSWYDTQIWEKPFLILKKDRLLATQKLEPLIEKFFHHFFFLLLTNIVFFSSFLLQ